MALVERDGELGKICTKCKQWKPLERFSPRKAMRDGYQSQCKPCNNAPNTTRQPVAVEGKVCTKCGEWKAIDQFYTKQYTIDGYRSACIACTQEIASVKRLENPEKARRQSNEWYANNREAVVAKRRIQRELRKDEISAYMCNWRKNNKDRMRDLNRKWRQKNKEKILECGRRSYRKHREKILVKQRRYAANNPHMVTAKSHRYRSRKLAAKGSFTTKEWQELKEYYNFTCLCCGKQEPEIRLTVDHVIPVTKDGDNDIANIQPLCKPCNSSKGAKTIDYRPAWEAEHEQE